MKSHDGWYYDRQSYLRSKIVMWSRLFGTDSMKPPVGKVPKIVEDEKSETKWIEKKSLDIGTEVSPVEKKAVKAVTDKESPQYVVMEKKSLTKQAEQQSTKTNMLKEVVSKGTFIPL